MPGPAQSLGQLDWVQCYNAAGANKAKFFGFVAWAGWDGNYDGWHFGCILLSQLYTDSGVAFLSAQGTTCQENGIGGRLSGNSDFTVVGSVDRGYNAFAVYATKNGTSTWAKAAPGSSTVIVVHGKSFVSVPQSLTYYDHNRVHT